GAGHAGGGRELVGGRLADALERAEVLEELALALGADAGDVLERRAQGPAAAERLVEGDREAVRLVADARQHEQLGGVGAQPRRLLDPRQEDAVGLRLA